MLNPNLTLTDAQIQEWFKHRDDDRDLFDALSEGIDGLLNYSFEALRDEELNDDEDEWN